MIPLPTIDVLDSITIPVACPAPWEDMRGDHRTRFCDKCSQNVHDVSELTAKEAVELVTGDVKPCVRLYRRQDGRVMTSDCATKRERVWKWLDRRSAWVAAVFALVFMGCAKPVERVMGNFCPPERPATKHEVAAHHNSEQKPSGRHGMDHTTSVSSMDAEAKAEAPVRHETTPPH